MKTNKQKNKGLLALLIATSIFVGCSKVDDLKTPQTSLNDGIKEEYLHGVTEHNGVLHFDSAETFRKLTTALGDMNECERDLWESQLGFQSLRYTLNSVMDQLDEAEEEELFVEIINVNSDIITYSDEEGALPRMASMMYASICNREGVFFVDGVINKVDGKRIASAEDGKLSTVEEALERDYLGKSTKSGGVDVFHYVLDQVSKSSNCGVEKSAWRTVGDRRILFKAMLSVIPCNSCCGYFTRQARLEFYAKNEKKNAFGKWKSYNTSTRMLGCTVDVQVPIVVDMNTAGASVFNYQRRTFRFVDAYSSYDCATMTRWFNIGDEVIKAEINNPVFYKVAGKASNRGVGFANYAEIDCGTGY